MIYKLYSIKRLKRIKEKLFKEIQKITTIDEVVKLADTIIINDDFITVAEGDFNYREDTIKKLRLTRLKRKYLKCCLISMILFYKQLLYSNKIRLLYDEVDLYSIPLSALSTNDFENKEDEDENKPSC